ncbi:hypothetical protein FACS1894130_02800 [Spirochaetia bacterium]|nr:hypothetical protein FACS1894130_02800 [Spirochaetia bacterium]
MDVEIRCNQSAFKHHITEADIRMAFDTARYDELLENDKYLLIGFDRNANLLEILYNVIDDNTINVFHAMKCTNTNVPLLPKE